MNKQNVIVSHTEQRGASARSTEVRLDGVRAHCQVCFEDRSVEVAQPISDSVWGFFP